MSNQIKYEKRAAERGEVFTLERKVNAMCDLVKKECERIDLRFLEAAHEKWDIATVEQDEETIIMLAKPLKLTQVVPKLKNTPEDVAPIISEYIPPLVKVGMAVIHKTFGEGEITWIKENKYVYVKFKAIGGKTFQYPEAFKKGFLILKR